MKIEIKNYFKIISDKISELRKLAKNKTKEDSNIIKVEFGKKEKKKKEEKINIDATHRKGAFIENDEDIKKRKKIIKQSYKIMGGMISLVIMTSVLNIRYKDYLNFSNYKEKPIESVAASSSINEYVVENTEPVAKANKVEEKVETPKKAKVVEKLTFSTPLKGEIQKMYSIDKVIYSKTLAQWKTHDGVDIGAPLGTDVKAIEKGVIEKIYYDSFYGVVIEIEHINGYKSSYANLDESVYVKVGQSVIKGEKIGKVGNTSVGESLDDPHLHFRLYLNNNIVNPTYIL